MAVQSTMLELGTPAPNIHLPDVVSGDAVSSVDYAGEAATRHVHLPALPLRKTR